MTCPHRFFSAAAIGIGHCCKGRVQSRPARRARGNARTRRIEGTPRSGVRQAMPEALREAFLRRLVPPPRRRDKPVGVSKGIVAHRQVRFALLGFLHIRHCGGLTTPTESAVRPSGAESGSGSVLMPDASPGGPPLLATLPSDCGGREWPPGRDPRLSGIPEAASCLTDFRTPTSARSRLRFAASHFGGRRGSAPAGRPDARKRTETGSRPVGAGNRALDAGSDRWVAWLGHVRDILTERFGGVGIQRFDRSGTLHEVLAVAVEAERRSGIRSSEA